MFDETHRRKLRESAKRRYAEGRNPNLHRGGGHLLGERRAFWKGDDAGRTSIHRWLYRNRERTGICQRCGKKPPSITYQYKGKTVTRIGTDWANVSGEYRREDPDDWVEICRSCHAKMDGFIKNIQGAAP